MAGWADWGNSVVVAGAGVSGASAALRVGTAAGGTGQAVGGVVAGARYRLAADARVSDPSETAYIGVNLIDAAGSIVGRQFLAFSNTTYSRLTTVEFQAAAAAVRAVVYVWKNGGSGYAYVDDFLFARVDVTQPDPNLVLNGGFESQLANWTVDLYYLDPNTTIVTDAASGTYAVRVPGSIYQFVSLVPGQRYRLSAQVKTSDPSTPGCVCLEIWNEWDEFLVQVPVPIDYTVGGGYYSGSIDFTAPMSNGYGVLYVQKKWGPGVVYADNISIVPL